MGRMKWIRAIFAAMAVSCAVTLTSCSGVSGTTEAIVVWQTEDGYVSGAPVEIDGWVYFLHQARVSSDVPARLHRVRSGGQPTVIDVTGVDCANPFLSRLRLLPDGRLGAVQHCVDKDRILISIDTVNGVAGRIMTVSPGTDVALAKAGGEAWLEYASKGCSSIAAVRNGKRQPAPVFRQVELLGWDVDRDFGDVSCVADGRIGFPRYEQDGTLIVLASSDSKGVDPGPLGNGRDNLSWRIFRLDAVAGKVELVGGEFFRPVAAELAFDKRRIMVAGQRDGRSGIWSASLTTGEVKAVAAGQLVALSARPDGRTILAIERTANGDLILILPSGPS